jgi:hypothetical protein
MEKRALSEQLKNLGFDMRGDSLRLVRNIVRRLNAKAGDVEKVWVDGDGELMVSLLGVTLDADYSLPYEKQQKDWGLIG